MPHLVQLDKRYSKKGLQIIGAEVQGSSKEAIEKINKEYKVKFPVTAGISGPKTGSGIPRAVVFSATGELVFLGHPADKNFDKSIKTALRAVKDAGDSGSKSALPDRPKPLVEKRAWTNTDGKTIQAEILSVQGDQVEFKLSNGKKVNYAIAKLSEEDQELIKKAQEDKAATAE